MANSDSFQNLQLPGECILVSLEYVAGPLLDAADRPALAKSTIIGNQIHVVIFGGQTEQERSVSLYHEILEAMTVAVFAPPLSVIDFNEADFDSAAYAAHAKFGVASPANVLAMLQFHGFQGQ